MEEVLKFDRAISRWLGGCLRQLQSRTTVPVHPVAFWLTTGLYLIIWTLLCRYEQQPEWMWYLVGAGMSTIAAYIADNEPVAPLDEGLALTHFGTDVRWALLRLAYVPLSLVLVVPLLLSGDYSTAFTVLLLVEILLFGLMEYLLCFRLVENADAMAIADPMNKLQALFQAAAEAVRAEQEKHWSEDRPAVEDVAEPDTPTLDPDLPEPPAGADGPETPTNESPE